MPIRCCYKPGHHVPAEPPGVIAGGGHKSPPVWQRGDAATGVTRRRWRGQSAELLYQGADKPVPEFISHNDQICGGGGAACRRCYLLEWLEWMEWSLSISSCWDRGHGRRAPAGLCTSVWSPVTPLLLLSTAHPHLQKSRFGQAGHTRNVTPGAPTPAVMVWCHIEPAPQHQNWQGWFDVTLKWL